MYVKHTYNATTAQLIDFLPLTVGVGWNLKSTTRGNWKTFNNKGVAHHQLLLATVWLSII